MKENSIRRKIAEKIDMPGDILVDCSIIRIIGNHEIVIENYKGILGYSDKKICVKAQPQNISITGNILEIKIITDEVLHITGKIVKVAFLNEGEG